MGIKFGPLIGSGFYNDESGGGGGGSYTDEMAQDAIGTILSDTTDIDLTYNDATPSITADLTVTGVAADTYGGTGIIPTITVDSKGRVTGASQAAYSITSANISDFQEAVEDAVGAAISSSPSVSATYVDASNSIEFDVVYSATAPQNIGTAAVGTSDEASRSDHVHGTPMTTNGDTLYYNSGIQRLAIGSNGYSLMSNGTLPSWQVPSQIMGTWRQGIDDFLGNAASSAHGFNWTTTSTGTGSQQVRVVSEAGTFGIVSLESGTTTTGRTAITTGLVNFYCGTGEFDCIWKAKLQAVPDGTESYTAYYGLGDTAAAGDMVDGIYFQADQTTGFWQIKSSNNSTRTTTTTSVALDTNWHILKMTANAAGTSVEFFIDGTSVGTITTNLPATSARSCGFVAKVEKSAGTTERIIYADYCYYRGLF